MEIRRFTVEQEVATSYDYLVGKLRAVFPALKEALFDVFWEGKDHVMFVDTPKPGSLLILIDSVVNPLLLFL